MEPFDEGFRSRQRGERADANPYPEDSLSHRRWLAGWEDLDEHFRHRDEALRSIGWI